MVVIDRMPGAFTNVFRAAWTFLGSRAGVVRRCGAGSRLDDRMSQGGVILQQEAEALFPV